MMAKIMTSRCLEVKSYCFSFVPTNVSSGISSINMNFRLELKWLISFLT
jgi:hypothetical protein